MTKNQREIQRKLIHGLGFAAKTGLAMCRQFPLQLLDLIGLRLNLFRRPWQLARQTAPSPFAPPEC